MPDLDIGKTTTPTAITDFSVSPESTDGVSDTKETIYDNPNFTKFYGLFLATNKVKSSLKSWATWITGLGRKEDNPALDRISGWGKDNFEEIL